MIKYLLPKDGCFYKVNMHSHSTLSDGGQTPEELKVAYKAAGYSAIAYTEHQAMFDLSYLNDDDFLAITSYELDINNKSNPPFTFYEGAPHCFDHVECVHLNLYAKSSHENAMVCYNPKYLSAKQKAFESKLTYVGPPDFERKYTIENINSIIKAAHEQGMLVIYNHPTWSLNAYPVYSQLVGLDGFEIINGASNLASDLDYTPWVYDQMARLGQRMICVGGDDNHGPSHFFQAWTMIKAESLTYENLFEGLKNGNCYSSQGPEIYDLYFEEKDGKMKTTIKSSPAVGIYLTTAGRRKGCKLGTEETPVNEVTFDIKPEDYYFRITVKDSKNRHANTRIYYLDELK